VGKLTAWALNCDVSDHLLKLYHSEAELSTDAHRPTLVGLVYTWTGLDPKFRVWFGLKNGPARVHGPDS